VCSLKKCGVTEVELWTGWTDLWLV